MSKDTPDPRRACQMTLRNEDLSDSLITDRSQQKEASMNNPNQNDQNQQQQGGQQGGQNKPGQQGGQQR